MNRDSLLRFLLIAGVGLGVWYFFLRPGSGDSQAGGINEPTPTTPETRAEEKFCTVTGNRFHAELSSRSAAVKRFKLDGDKYTVDGRAGGPPMDLVTTPDRENYQPLRAGLRGAGADQVPFDNLDWTIAESTPKSCTFTYEAAGVALRKVIRAGERPFELEAELTVTNKGDKRATHVATWDNGAWRYSKEVEGGFGRQSPFLTTVECVADGKLVEKTASDFSPKDLTKPEYKENWFTVNGKVDYASTSNFYFASALVPLDGPSPACQLQVWDAKEKFDGALYRSRLAYPAKELGPGESASYKVLLFNGPKEREVLAGAAGGDRRVGDLIKLGTFAIIAKVLVQFLIMAKSTLGSWGLAIIVLTITVRTVLFPLTWRQIKSGAQMRQLKPEIDKLNEKFKDDAQQKQLATMELWKKHGVNPLSGCLPVVAQMPVWFALYTSLQTAAELYHTPFLWFRDLSAPDTIHVGSWDAPFLLPVLLGATTFIQQKLMPQQMDPAQQKMMTYMMPAVFTAMMLFLPAGLGVYMFTNSVLGIAQTLAVEKYYANQASKKSGGDGGSGIEVREKETPSKPSKDDGKATRNAGEKETPALPLGKGNARV
jgi:YidC/Oxa1 family membrane protein insertase